jgi:hypothetical protein
MDQIKPDNLRKDAIAGEMELINELSMRLAQIRRKDHKAWYQFAPMLIAFGRDLIQYGHALVDEGNRIEKLVDMPRSTPWPLPRFNDVNKWLESLTNKETNQ